MRTDDVTRLYADYVLATYRQAPICLVKGKGSYVEDIHGKEYLDFFPGWGVSGLGHAHPRVVYALKNQAHKILHVSNNFMNVKQARLAEALITRSFPGKVFFCNSGTEAIEGAVKFARKFGAASGRYEIISMESSFHGRTMASMTATGQKKIHDGFGPLPEGFKYARLNDLASVERLITDKTAAVLLEPIQGEGGIHVAERSFLEGLKKLAERHHFLLIFDEIQTGMGRTGHLFAYQGLGVTPDIMALAKSLGGGVPIGAIVVGEKCAKVIEPGMHGSTYGGNPLVSAAALAVIDVIERGKLLQRTKDMGAYLMTCLEKLKEKYSVIKEIRGMGLMRGVELKKPGAGVATRCLEKGLIINCTQDVVLRIMPAMIVTKREIDKAMQILDGALGEEGV